ncbi:anti-sigma factor [Patescibacteria group bacterium]
MNKKVSIAILIIVIAGVVIFLITRDETIQKTSTSEQKQMSDEEKVMTETPTLTEKSPIEGIAANPKTKKGVLADVTGGNSSGTAYVLRDNQIIYHTVTANLPDPQGNNKYEGWLVKKGIVPKFFSTGVMQKDSDGNYALSYTSTDLSEGYDFVVITEETVVDKNPEKHIIEGTVE